MVLLNQLTSNFSIFCGFVTSLIKFLCRATSRDHHQGLGLNESDDNEDEYESYRKRMMLAYRFRPNPLVKKFQNYCDKF